MKAIVMQNSGAPDVLSLEESPTPVPANNEVVVKLQYAGINHLDVWIRKGNPAYPITLPHILGADGSGIVDAVGPDAEGVSIGDRVLIFPGISCGECEFCKTGHDNQCERYAFVGAKNHGTYAQYVKVPDLNVVALPDDFSFEAAAAFPLTYLTAWHMLFGKAQLKAGETVLITGASSGVGVAAIQLAKWKGARALALTSSRHKISKIKELGADEVFHVEGDADFSKWALQQTEGKGAHVVIEHVGPATWEKSIRALRKCGRLSTCGATTGPTAILDLRYVFSRDLSIFGCRMGTQREFRALCEVMFQQKFTPLIDKIFPLADAASAHDYLEGKQHVGKILLQI
jgi:NADPH:quinone reductase-like Zn-dependent oxidoreductase